MDPSLFDPNLPIAEFIRRCQQRMEGVDEAMRHLREEREGLMRMISAYTTLRSVGPSPVHVFHSEPTVLVRNVQPPSRPVPAAGVGTAAIGHAPSALERSRNEQILSHVALLLLSGRRKTADLVEMLNRAGVQWTSSNPTSLLSTLMSKDDRFVANRRLGWGLRGRDPEDLDEE